MFGSAMSPDKWNRTGGISISAPEQIKAVSPPRASSLQPLPPVERPTEAHLLIGSATMVPTNSANEDLPFYVYELSMCIIH